MTITTSRRGREQASSPSGITWTAIQSGLWVGKSDGEFAGMIEARWGEGFAATTRLGKQLGTYPTVEQAEASFTA